MDLGHLQSMTWTGNKPPYPNTADLVCRLSINTAASESSHNWEHHEHSPAHLWHALVVRAWKWIDTKQILMVWFVPCATSLLSSWQTMTVSKTAGAAFPLWQSRAPYPACSVPSRRIVWPNPGTYQPLTYSGLLDDLMGEKNSPVRVSSIVSTVISSVCTPKKQAQSVEVEIMAGQKQAT